jgi:hypothetical protein
MWESLYNLVWPALAAVGTIFIGGGVVTSLAFGLFKLFGESWLNNRFAERLAAFRHDQAKELERLKFEINKLLDRSAKLHQWEFEVLPKAWTLLAKGYHSVRAVTSALQSYADVSRMGEEQLDEFIAGLPLEGWQKAELKNADDKNNYYQDAIFWHRLNEARTATQKSAMYISENGIFMPTSIKKKFDQINALAWDALIEHESNKAYDVIPRKFTQQERFKKKVKC